jgi:undecaprenyl-diphosphatase
MDQALTHWINSFAGSTAFLDFFMIGVTDIGVPVLIALVVVQWWSKTDRLHVRHSCVAAGLSFLTALAINQCIILFVHRVRPYDAGISHLIVAKSTDWAFPSDHTTASVAVVTTFVLNGLPRRAISFAVLAMLISWSRIFVGTHYVTDVLGGCVTGVAGAMLVRMFYRKGSRLDSIATQIL